MPTKEEFVKCQWYMHLNVELGIELEEVVELMAWKYVAQGHGVLNGVN